jgi:hypothetical protein
MPIDNLIKVICVYKDIDVLQPKSFQDASMVEQIWGH